MLLDPLCIPPTLKGATNEGLGLDSPDYNIPGP
jgi:hypothetical protein